MTRTIRSIAILLVVVLASPVTGLGQTTFEDLRKVGASLTAEQVAELRKQANAGDPRAQTLLGIAFQNGTVVSVNEELAANWLRKAAEQGFPPAQNMLGKAYEIGIGLTQDREQALSWYKQAARRGYPAAQFNVGNYYERDTDFKDVGLAYAWWTIAAENGDPTARDGLTRFKVAQRGDMVRIAQLVGDMLLDGADVPQNVREGEKWLHLAFEKGSRQSAERLIRIYLNGGLLPRDVTKALSLLESMAAEDQNASLRLADMYAKGEGLPQDDSKAFEWELHAFKLMSRSPSLPRLGPMLRVATAYWQGRGVPKDPDKGAMLLFVGGALGDQPCQQQFRLLQLSPKDAERARKDAEKWFKDKENIPFLQVYNQRLEALRELQRVKK